MARSNDPIVRTSIPPSGGNVSVETHDALWREFGSANSQESFCRTWLALQCLMIPGVSGGVVLLGAPEENRPYTPIAFWPAQHTDLKHLADVAQRAVTDRRGLIIKRQSTDNGPSAFRYDIAYPVQVAGR